MEILLYIAAFIAAFGIGVRVGNFADFHAYREHVDAHSIRVDLPNCPYCREERCVTPNQKWWPA